MVVWWIELTRFSFCAWITSFIVIVRSVTLKSFHSLAKSKILCLVTPGKINPLSGGVISSLSTKINWWTQFNIDYSPQLSIYIYQSMTHLLSRFSWIRKYSWFQPLSIGCLLRTTTVPVAILQPQQFSGNYLGNIWKIMYIQIFLIRTFSPEQKLSGRS